MLSFHFDSDVLTYLRADPVTAYKGFTPDLESLLRCYSDTLPILLMAPVSLVKHCVLHPQFLVQSILAEMTRRRICELPPLIINCVEVTHRSERLFSYRCAIEKLVPLFVS